MGPLTASDSRQFEQRTSTGILERRPCCTCPPDPAQLALFETEVVELALD